MSTIQSCKDCANCIPEDETRARTGRHVGAPICMALGHVLGRPGASPEQTARTFELFAESCPSYGTMPATQKPVVGGQVAIGDPQIAVRMATVYPTGVPDGMLPTVCSACENYISPEIVRDELGWPVAMCAAKGKLLFAVNLVREAADCGTGTLGTPRSSTIGMTLMPQFATPVTVRTSGATGAATHTAETIAQHRVDPRQYVTDRPVTPDDEAECIRAWRKVDDPEGLHEPVFMPIFDGEKLCGFDPRTTYGSHRPDLYIDHQGLLYDMAVEFFGLDETPVLIGRAGTGKTELLCHIAYLCDLPFYRISVDKGTEPWHLTGEAKLSIDPDTQQPVTTFKLGRYAKAYTEPCIVCVDEPNVKSDIFETLRPSFDNARQLVIDADQGFTAQRHRWCRVGCAQNPSFDPLYIGTEPMSAADIDRISPIYVDLPNADMEREIIRAHCKDDGYDISDTTLDKIMQAAESIRAMIEDGTLSLAWGLRSQIKVARKTKFYSLEKAYRRAVLDGMEPEVVNSVMGIVRGVA